MLRPDEQMEIDEGALCPSCGDELDADGECGYCSEHGNDLAREADNENA